MLVKSRPRSWRVPGSKPDSIESLLCNRAWCALNPSGPNFHPPVWWGSLKRGVQAQASSSSSDLMPRNLLTCITKVFIKLSVSPLFPSILEDCSCAQVSKDWTNKKLPGNYRPISLLSNLGKIYEKVILARTEITLL
ncbi:hypothetical protein AVEN_272416-1 [Araneus ventricosus]|uniref:Reverse transcriptase domain-containing protein n=1 Tax=Araneus ventricosus TaxID=182803 RepID=A0A4Y2QWJ4_ARAVE|nr:hypothetical protein AVEN_272416-1 [Araneus ventricosus]